MFMGEFQHNVDTKGRIIVPSKFREELGESFVVTRGLDKCLFAYPMDEGKILEEKLKILPLTNEDARDFTRFFMSGAVECEVYKQDRINIPKKLRTYASLEKECVVIGISNRVEFWGVEQYEDYFNAYEESLADI